MTWPAQDLDYLMSHATKRTAALCNLKAADRHCMQYDLLLIMVLRDKQLFIQSLMFGMRQLELTGAEVH